jgi:hypothetical protein
LVCWSPIILFTKESIDMAMFAWDWLVAARPEVEIWMIVEFYSAWEWMMSTGNGLFSSSTR